MAVQEFGIPTGFEADLESIEQVTEIKKTETANRKLILYFDEVNRVCVFLLEHRFSAIDFNLPFYHQTKIGSNNMPWL